VNDCCTPKGYRTIFSERNAASEAKTYRKKGLDATSLRIFKLLQQRGVSGATVLEVGGGIGALQIELLKAGAAKAVSIELTPTYETAANELLREAGLQDRVERQILDFAEGGEPVPAADIVIMNRVICCYHDMPKLAGQAAGHTNKILVLSYPREWTRLGLALFNAGMWAIRMGFQVFVHSHRAIEATAGSYGLKKTYDDPGFMWQVASFTKNA
jgi:hypothetical protein